MPDLHSDAREDSFSPIINSADGEIIDAKSLIQRVTLLLLHKSFNLHFADTTQEMINTHCGTRLLTDSTSYFHLKSLWAPYSHAKKW